MGRKKTEEIKFYVTLSLPKGSMDEDNWQNTYDFITMAVDQLADSLDGEVEDLEIK